ncbi:MAG: hypothetical protein Q8K64_00840 [Sediminibacterium sp.]|nr:hypothetical protein [Sediminibacterium sp.]
MKNIVSMHMNHFLKVKFSSMAIIIGFVIPFISGCEKSNILHVDKHTLSSQIASSEKFSMIINNLSTVKKHIKAFSSPPSTALTEAEINKEISSIKNENSLKSLLLKFGHQNPEVIVNQTINVNNLIMEIFKQYPILHEYDKNGIMDIFTKAYFIRKYESNMFIKGLDVCSQNYASGMNDCTEDLGFNIIMAGLSGFLAGGGIAAPASILLFSAVAYYQEHRCKVRVVKQWQQCRGI